MVPVVLSGGCYGFFGNSYYFNIITEPCFLFEIYDVFYLVRLIIVTVVPVFCYGFFERCNLFWDPFVLLQYIMKGFSDCFGFRDRTFGKGSMVSVFYN